MVGALQELVASRIDAGWDMAEVERELVQTARGLTSEELDALWLFAWSYQASGMPSWELREPVGQY